MSDIDPGLIARHAAPVPRYTSYPTTPHFSPAVGYLQYVDWLTALPVDADLSLYLHIPYCHELCWYCGCTTKAAQRYQPVARYLEALEAEIDAVASLVPQRHAVTHIHWGGGSPNILAAGDIGRLAERLEAAFQIVPAAERAVEIDPRHLTLAQADALAAAGVSRISIGVQDFDPAVQRAINRIQSFETTQRAIAMFRERGVGSVNVDLVYGLPHQTHASFRRTMELVLRLAPDRVAAFGYAHLPARLKRQRLIDGEALPGPLDRHVMSDTIAAMLVEAGYVRVGLDHFARPSDTLARRPLMRNFQGYTTDRAAALIGFGASAIGRIGDAYVQNATPIADYMRRIGEDGLAVARGLLLTDEDIMRAFVIERLMCDLEFPGEALVRRFGMAARPLHDVAEALLAADTDHLVERSGAGFRVTERGRPLLRSLCAHFDAYLHTRPGLHAAGV